MAPRKVWPMTTGASALTRSPALRVDRDLLALRNGKVAGVLSGLQHARSAAVVIADDDVRHTRSTLERLCQLLNHTDVVRPQNHFATIDDSSLPWHARWDTGRSLVNRGLSGDWPGTLALRRSALPRTPYDGEVLFENLEMVRTVLANGGRQHLALDLFVPRLPPTAPKFWSQRVRQAYDSFAQPSRLVAELAVLPLAFIVPSRGAVSRSRRRGDRRTWPPASRRHDRVRSRCRALGCTLVGRAVRVRVGSRSAADCSVACPMREAGW